MSIILSLLPALVALAGLTVALTARTRVLAATGAGMSTLVFGGFAYVGTDYGYPAAGWLLGTVAALNFLLTVAVATEFRPPAKTPEPDARLAEARAQARTYGPLSVELRPGLTGHTVTVETADNAVAAQLGVTPIDPIVAERSDGRLVVPVPIPAHDRPVQFARAYAASRGAVYVPMRFASPEGSASRARADLAVDNIAGGAL